MAPAVSAAGALREAEEAPGAAREERPAGGGAAEPPSPCLWVWNFKPSGFTL